jgi:hypothetical protein
MEVAFFFAPFPSNPEVLIRSGGDGEFLVLAALLHVTTSTGELAEEELLG